MYLIANFKQNKTVQEAFDWVEQVNFNLLQSKPNAKVIVAPPLPYLYLYWDYFKEKYPNLLQFHVYLGAQNISEHTDGSHTGEVGANQLKGFVNYVIIGHSERRKEGEGLRQIINKIMRAREARLTPIVCVSGLDEFNLIKQNTTLNDILFAYEPLLSIGTGNNASIQEVLNAKQGFGLDQIIYGGSIDEKNIYEYVKHRSDGISGFLVGATSLDSVKFTELIRLIN